jgi:hypothetical protein
MGKKKEKRRAPVETRKDERSRKQEREPDDGNAVAPDGVSGNWS